MLKTVSLSLVIAALTALAALPRPARAGLLLNEFLAGPARDWDGSGALSTRDDEWVEVVNGGASALDLGGFFLTDGDTIPRYGFAGTLGPGERRLVFGTDAVTWERANGFPVFGLSLGNTGDRVMLWQASGGDTTLIDSYTYLSHEAAADRAVGRGTDGGAWMLFDGLDPYTGSTPPLGSGCPPSPGAPNACGATPTLKASWGKIKAAYR
jgi:hypothetical protein